MIATTKPAQPVDAEPAGGTEEWCGDEICAFFVFQLILTGIFLPWVEELYFRGYLLPRISRFQWWAPLVSGLFFGLYHIWQPYGFLTVFLLGAALSALVMWTRDLRMSISLHVAANLFARLALLLAALTL